MSAWSMDLIDGINHGRAITMEQKEIRRQLNEYFDSMVMPEGTDATMRMNVKLWMNHYMDGTCSFESLVNVLNYWGVGDLLKINTPYPMAVDKEGHLVVYKIESVDSKKE